MFFEWIASHLDRVNIDEVVREGILLRRLTRGKDNCSPAYKSLK
jgi:hypothetical protein